jgi:hypothetical protein
VTEKLSRFKWNNLYTLQGQNFDPTIDAVYTDGEYIVQKHLLASKPFAFRLAIKREDKEPIRDWRVLQDIKNAVAGPDCEAIELYPPESEVTDTGNMYHLWVFREGFGVPVRLIPPITNNQPQK